MYLTYEEYQNMGGALDEATFNDLEFEAESLVNWYTFNRLHNDVTIPDAVKRLMRYLINTAQTKAELLTPTSSESGGTAAIASQSNDGVSISYNVLSAKDLMDSLKVDSESTIRRYLQGVMNEAGRLLLYRGVYPNE